MKVNRTANVFALALVGVLGITSNLQAAEIWSHVASSCTVDEIDVARAKLSYARLMFGDNRTGTITARCNITNPRDNGDNPGWDQLKVTYRDNDGNLLDREERHRINVKVSLYRVAANGGVSQPPLVTFESKEFNVVGDTTQTKNFNNVAWDFERYSYYLEIQLTRLDVEDANPNVSISSIRLLDVE